MHEIERETLEFPQSKAKLHLIKKGNIVMLHLDSFANRIEQNESIAIPKIFMPEKITDFIIVAHRAGDAEQGGNIRITMNYIQVNRPIEPGYILQTTWIAKY